MPETQNIEYKSSWRDEYLKWICGFANAQGGVLFIGKDNDGNVVGVKNAARLLEDLPNKITNILGIVAAVNLHETKRGAYIEIVVEPQPNPVNYKGEYHFRSGSTKQELKGAALDKFLLQKYGRKWDSVLIPNARVDELKRETFEFFKERGIDSNRLDERCRKDAPARLLENMNLLEDGRLKRAALLLFHPNPEKFATGAYVKIGFFHSDSDLLFQDDIHGNLFEQVERTMELLLTKYTKALISYRGLSRIETHEFPKEALREALLNAVTHKEYAGGAPIQIKVYNDKITIWNEGRLPENWTIEDLMKSHSSRPNNPDIANAFFRSGYVESWGRGISKIEEQCSDAGLPMPIFENLGSDFLVTFVKAGSVSDATVKDTANATIKDTVNVARDTVKDSVNFTGDLVRDHVNIVKDPVNVSKDGLKDGVKDGVNGGANTTVNATVKDTVNVVLTEKQQAILENISKNPFITSDEISKIVGVNLRNTKKNIAMLKENGLIKRVGADKNGYWKILDTSR